MSQSHVRGIVTSLIGLGYVTAPERHVQCPCKECELASLQRLESQLAAPTKTPFDREVEVLSQAYDAMHVMANGFQAVGKLTHFVHDFFEGEIRTWEVLGMTNKAGEMLTDEELKLVREKDMCPDCKFEGTSELPSKRLTAQRDPDPKVLTCEKEDCRSKFRDMGPFGIERVTDAQPKKEGRKD